MVSTVAGIPIASLGVTELALGTPGIIVSKKAGRVGHPHRVVHLRPGVVIATKTIRLGGSRGAFATRQTQRHQGPGLLWNFNVKLIGLYQGCIIS